MVFCNHMPVVVCKFSCHTTMTDANVFLDNESYYHKINIKKGPHIM